MRKDWVDFGETQNCECCLTNIGVDPPHTCGMCGHEHGTMCDEQALRLAQEVRKTGNLVDRFGAWLAISLVRFVARAAD